MVYVTVRKIIFILRIRKNWIRNSKYYSNFGNKRQTKTKISTTNVIPKQNKNKQNLRIWFILTHSKQRLISNAEKIEKIMIVWKHWL